MNRRKLFLRSSCLLALCGLLLGCGSEQPQVRLAAITGGESDPTMLFEGFRMVSSRGKQTEWEFQARAAQIYEKIRLAKAQDIRVTYWQNGEVASILTARRGLIRTNNNDMQAEEQVLMVSKDGTRLLTDKLQWEQGQQRIKTDAPVRVERQGNILTGVGLVTDADLKHLEILSQVKIQVPSVKALRNNMAPAETGVKP